MNGRMSSELIAILGVGATVLVIGVAVLALGWNMYDGLNGRIDAMQAENHRQHDTLQEQINRRFDTMQAENQRQHDAILEVLRLFEGRISRLEERTGTGAESTE